MYLWDVEGAIGAFTGSFLIKKKVGGECGTGWQSIHIVQVGSAGITETSCLPCQQHLIYLSLSRISLDTFPSRWSQMRVGHTQHIASGEMICILVFPQVNSLLIEPDCTIFLEMAPAPLSW